MRRSRLFRLFGLLFAPWFAAVAGDLPALDLCPMHGSHAVASATHAAQSPLHMAGHSHSAPASPHDTSHHGCTCLGCCCVASGTALASGRVDVLVPVIVRRTVAVPVFRGAAIARVAHVLPFATAPPRAID